MWGRGDGALEGTDRVRAVGTFFPRLLVWFTIRVVGTGVGEFDLEGIAEEGAVNLVVIAVGAPFLIVPSNDSRPSSVE